jgi:Two component regulator propeller
MLRSLRLVLGVLLLTSTSFLVEAAGPVFWTVASQADFLKGHASGVSIDATGRLIAAPAVTVVHDLGAPQAWSLARGDDGAWYAGTGGDGRVVRGRGTTVTTILDVEPSAIHAIAVSGGRVYAASSPDGRVHVIEADGSSRVFFDPAEPYIWAMTADRQGRLWVATGHPATIHRVNPDGTSAVVYRPTARHVVSLAVDQSGRVFAGTDQPARLYRFDASDRPFVVLESGLTELRSIQPAPDGGLFVAAITASGEAGGESAVTGSVTITVGGAVAGTSTTTGATPAPPSGRKSVVYHVDAAGVWDPLWETTDAIYDLAVIDDRTVLAATGPDGRLYQLHLDGTVLLLSTVDARQVTRLLRDGARTLMVSANPGRVLALNTAGTTSPTATYRSPVRDAKTLAQWGTIQWDGTGSVTLQTRSGNTEEPDDSWSDWSPAYTTATGQPIQSPGARFLQWRAQFPAASNAVLTSVTVAYLPRNTRPTVTEITVHPAGVVFQRPFSSDEGAIAGLDDAIAESRRPPGGETPNPPSLGRRMFQRGLRTFQWKAEDADTDRLTYSLHHRREGDTTWHELKSSIADALFVWDTTAVADGRYFVRVSASDGLSNTPDRVLSGQRESAVVDVDNTAPVITTTVTGLRVEIRVVDGHSGVQRVEYTLGGQAWQVLRPMDGLADSRDERFELTLPSADAAGRVVIRAVDVMQNVASVGLRGPRP